MKKLNSMKTKVLLAIGGIAARARSLDMSGATALVHKDMSAVPRRHISKLTVKITLPRPRPQGGIGETDMHAAQQHVPLQEIRVPWPAP